MTYSPILIVHIVAGMTAVLSGTTALVVRKGSPLHRKSGKVFAVSMLAMAAGGAYIAMMKSQTFNVFAGTLTFYLVTTAWLTVRRRERETGRAEVGLMIVALTLGAVAWILALNATHRSSVMGYFIFGSIAFAFGAGDVRMLIRGGVAGAQRLGRHLWRMGFALFVASGSFFLGTASDPVLKKTGLRATLFTKEIRATHLPDVPVILVVVLTLYWLFRVKFGKAYRKAEPRTTLPSPSFAVGAIADSDRSSQKAV